MPAWAVCCVILVLYVHKADCLTDMLRSPNNHRHPPKPKASQKHCLDALVAWFR